MQKQLISSAHSMQWACAFFFGCLGLTYASVMARSPALKLQSGTDEAQFGVALLCLGLGGVSALPLSGGVTLRIGSRIALLIGSLCLLLAFPCVGLAEQAWQLYLTFFVVGAGIGFSEVPMNTQAMLLERRWGRACMSTMHAMFSLGGLAGSALGSCFVLWGFSPLWHFVSIALALLCILPWSFRSLSPDSGVQHAGVCRTSHQAGRILPWSILLCGFMALCSYASEGSVAEWGSLLLYQEKGASESLAALAFAAFSVTMTVSRLVGDRIRDHFGNFGPLTLCAILATAGILVVLLSPRPWLSLLGYACMGMGLSLIVPTLFSLAGSQSAISPAASSAVISFLGYTGQLLVPPCIGILGAKLGLTNALLIIAGLCLMLVFGACSLRKLWQQA